jgi:hypothetical protein
MSQKLSIKELRDLLQPRIEEILAKLAPGGRRDGGTYIVKNPTRDDRRPGSFVIWLRGSMAGAYRDYAGRGGEDKGDIIDLISYLHNRGKDRVFAIRWAEDFLGIKRMNAAELAAVRVGVARKSEQKILAESQEQMRRQKRAFDMWLNASRNIAGTLAEAYLAQRGITWRELVNPELGELRFARSLEHWKSTVWRTEEGTGRREKVSTQNYPAIVSAIRGRAGEVTAVHCTFLDEQTAGKAPVELPKLMLGQVQGGVVRISRGASNLTPLEAGAAGVSGPVVISEGIEDALSIAIALPDVRVWAATSLSNIGNAPVDMPCVESIVVAADNDWSQPQAREALERAVDQLGGYGKAVTVMRAHEGKDFNDLIRGEKDDDEEHSH